MVAISWKQPGVMSEFMHRVCTIASTPSFFLFFFYFLFFYFHIFFYLYILHSSFSFLFFLNIRQPFFCLSNSLFVEFLGKMRGKRGQSVL